MANTRDKDLATQAYSAAADDYSRKDGATNGTRKISPFDEHGQFRNALAVAGAVAFDGTSGARVISTLTNQNLGTDAGGFSFWMRVPSANPASHHGCVYLGSSTTTVLAANTLCARVETSGSLIIKLFNAAGNGSRDYTIANFVANFGGKWVFVAAIRSGASMVVTINGVATTGTDAGSGTSPPADWSIAVTSTYLGVGYNANAEVAVGVFRDVFFWNMAPSASDLVEVYELNGPVPERFKSGSQAPLYEANMSNYSGWATFASADGRSLAVTKTSTAAIARARGLQGFYGINSGVIRKWRMSFDLTLNSGTAPDYNLDATDNGGNSAEGAQLSVVGHNSFVFTPARSGIGGNALFVFRSKIADVTDFSVANFGVTLLGVVVHLPLDDGFGLQLQDASTNRLHALMATTGVSHVVPFAGPVPLSGTTNTNGNQQLLGAACVPIGADVEVWARAESGTPTIDVGNASAGAQLVSAAALTTAWKKLSLVGGGHVTTTTAIWIKGNSTDVIDVKLFLKDIRL